jgi:hypothetical protein
VDSATPTPFDLAPHFRVVGAPPRTYGHLVMQASVLDRVAPRTQRLSPQSRLSIYLGRWRKRLETLATERADPITPVVWSPRCIGPALDPMLQGPPPFAACRPPRPLCGRPAACPSCWARRAAKLWRRIDAGLFAAGPRVGAGASLIRREATYTVPALTAQEYADARLGGWAPPGLASYLGLRLDRRPRHSPARRGSPRRWLQSRLVETRRLLRMGVVAGLDATIVDVGPPDDLDDGPTWTIAIRQLLFVRGEPSPRLLEFLRAAPGVGDEFDPDLPPGTARARVLYDPCRRDVARGVAASLPYRYRSCSAHPTSP